MMNSLFGFLAIKKSQHIEIWVGLLYETFDDALEKLDDVIQSLKTTNQKLDREYPREYSDIYESVYLPMS